MIRSLSSAPQKMVPRQLGGDKTCGSPLARDRKPDLVMQVKMGNTHVMLCMPGLGTSACGEHHCELWSWRPVTSSVKINPPSFWRVRVLGPQWGQQGTGLGYLWENLWQEHAAITFDLAKGKWGVCPETKTNIFFLLFLLPEMPGLEEEWPEWWKQ